MDSIDDLVQRVQQTQHGFMDIKKTSEMVVRTHPTEESLDIARNLLTSEVYQARTLAVFIFGHFAAKSENSLRVLRETVSQDADWRVQEILAQAFDMYCKQRGYEQALPVIVDWLKDPAANVRRAVTEGLRIWTSRPYFKEHPEQAIQLLSQLRNDPSEYVRRSTGNALRDISRKYPNLVRAELDGWNLTDKHVAQTYKLASKFII